MPYRAAKARMAARRSGAGARHRVSAPTSRERVFLGTSRRAPMKRRSFMRGGSVSVPARERGSWAPAARPVPVPVPLPVTRSCALERAARAGEHGYATPVRIALLSDTHGLSDPKLPGLFQGCARVLHAGDIVSTPVLRALGDVAEVTAVRGNNDHGPDFERL